MLYGRIDIDQHFVCDGDTGLECPTHTPTTAPGLPVPFRELDARHGTAGSLRDSVPILDDDFDLFTSLMPSLPTHGRGAAAVFGRDDE